MEKPGLHAALTRGEPLVDFVVHFCPAVDGVAAAETLNSLADDLRVQPRPWYDAQSRSCVATRAAVQRIFGWKLIRGKVPGQPRGYWWEEVSPPDRHPPELQGAIESLGLSQPGGDDDGRWFEWFTPGT